MTEDLPWDQMVLTESEDVEVNIQSAEIQGVVSRGQNYVIGKLLADRLVSKETIKKGLMKGWKLKEKLSFKVLGDNLFMIDFVDLKDKERVLEGRPWDFEGCLFLVEDFDGSVPSSKFTFEKAAFWVHMINLPLGCMGRDIGRKIGETVGEVELVDADDEGIAWGEFLRVKIVLDLTKPLQRGRKLNIQGEQFWVTFQYERLPKFCFFCGVIKHGRGGCSQRSMLRQQNNPQYGMWLRAASPMRRTKQTQNWFGTKRGPSSPEKRRRWDGDGDYGRRRNSSEAYADERMGGGEEHQWSRNPKDKNGKSTTSGENSGKTANPGINGNSTTSGGNSGKDANSKDLSGSKYGQERNGNNERNNSGNKDFPCNNGERDKWTPYMGNQTSDDPILNSKNPAQSITSPMVEVTNKAMNDGPNSVVLESTKESPRFSFTGPLISKVEKRMKINSQDSELKPKGK
jgi:hypothetical protein